MENANQFVSQLPLPARSGDTSPQRGLSEMPHTAANSRDGSRKHHISNLPEPAAKRVTLAERAGEPLRLNQPAPPSTRSVNPAVNTINTMLPPAKNFSQSYRSNSSVTRTISSSSNNSFSSSVGPTGIRRPASQVIPRPKTSLAKARNTSNAEPRPATAMETRGGKISEGPTKKAWDTEEQYANVEAMHEDIKQMNTMLNQAMNDTSNMKDSISLHKSTIQTLEKDRASLIETNIALRTDIETTKYSLASTERAITDLNERHDAEIGRIQRQARSELERELDFQKHAHLLKIEQMKSEHQDAIRTIKKESENQIEEERTLRVQLLNQTSTAGELQKQQEEMRLNAKEQEIKAVKAEVLRMQSDLERESMFRAELQTHLTAANASVTDLEIARRALQAKIEYLESDNKSQSESYAAMERAMNEAVQRAELADVEVRKAESQRRRDRDTIQQLKGNIQVIARQRPALPHDNSTDLATMSYPDIDQMNTVEVRGPEEKSSLGTVVTKTHPFTFDKAFGPSSTNDDIYNEICPLVQSSIDGYNVCMFAYGQTGSGKTYTMSASDGVMPRAIHHIYDTTKNLEKLGWKYTVQGKFLEVYNENINDLLGDVDQMDKKKHEIKHDLQRGETTITDVTVVDLDSQEMVESIVEQAMAKRSVAATKMNERSSRSHSVFILTLSGHNSITGESSRGTLNLVDLAGSERVSRSKVEGDRLKETQNINKSLSSLGDVIGALGKKEQHIPYRNSKLTHLLQLSLGGNSKTLMFVMVSPLKEHLGETLTSLKFATKVHGTHIGTAKKIAK